MDSGTDTGDTGTTSEQEQEPIISAAKLAGETGGISCASINTIFPSLIFAAGLILISRTIR
tara:strand:- start:1038 stop:1220 length:183 start_codon:yes stop_codon:yes gene_type:complete